MKKLSLLATFLYAIFFQISAQNTGIEGDWALDNIELSDFAEMDESFTEETSFFAYYLDKSNTLNLSQSTISLQVGGEPYVYEVSFKNGDLVLNYSNTVYIKKDDGPVESHISIGETVFKMQHSANKLVLFRKNQTFYERYTFVLSN